MLVKELASASKGASFCISHLPKFNFNTYRFSTPLKLSNNFVYPSY
jgi:hypothetical protein